MADCQPDPLVVFHDHGNHWLDALLAPGFKHCFCAIADERGYWISVDGRMGRPVIRCEAATDYDLETFYTDQGFTVVRVPEWARGSIRTPLVFSNCVGMVKAALGINAFGVITPRQLYRKLHG
jgi:hypothetical protein